MCRKLGLEPYTWEIMEGMKCEELDKLHPTKKKKKRNGAHLKTMMRCGGG